jgi:hypothetical protein
MTLARPQRARRNAGLKSSGSRPQNPGLLRGTPTASLALAMIRGARKARSLRRFAAVVVADEVSGDDGS